MTLFNDVFSQDAFGFASLTAAVNELPYTESRLGEMALFGTPEGLETDTAIIDMTEGQIGILSTRQRGAPPERALKDKKNTSRVVMVPHLQFEDRVSAASLIGKRKPGMQNEVESVADKLNDRFTKMINMQLEPTREIHRLGALRGQLLDADGSVIEDYFDLFDVVQQTHNYVFTAATTDIRAVTQQAIRKIRNSLGGVPFTGVRAICGANFYDALISHAKVRDTYLNHEAASQLRENMINTPFAFGGVIWEEYRGMDNLGAANLGTVDPDECIMFPEGVPGMYRTYVSPAGFLETVNTIGIDMYAKVAPDWKYGEHVDQLIESNPLYINTRPRAVLKVTAS